MSVRLHATITLLSSGIEWVRMVAIVGLEAQADGGLHVARNGEVGGLRLVGLRS